MSKLYDVLASMIGKLNQLDSKYTKPSTGIPKSDLASSVQTSLGKADTALQSYTETDPTVPAWAKAATKPSYTASDVGAAPATHTHKKTDISDFPATMPPSAHNHDDRYYTETETDAKYQPKGNYLTQHQSLADYAKKSEIPVVPTKISAFTNDSGYATTTQVNAKYTKPSTGIPKTDLASAVQTSLSKADTALQSFTETDPTVPSWAKAAKKPTYTASEVGADPAGAASTAESNAKAYADGIKDDLLNDVGFQEHIVQQVVTALGTPVFGTIDADNNIILSGALTDGAYTLKYENADGTKTTIGTLTVADNSGGGTEETDVDVPITWILNTKLSKTTGEVESATDGDYNASDYIEIVPNAQYTIATETDVFNAMNVVYYDSNKAFVSYQANCWASNNDVENPEDGTPQSCVLEIPDGAAYFRLRQFETWNVQGASTEYITLSYTLL